ncbi:MAG: hypothetical protein QME47_03735 [Candidatus Thermoplasmatota archaeon]|nr:hypothetical protein [Candidatus Thermoplasmatota archaeon]
MKKKSLVLSAVMLSLMLAGCISPITSITARPRLIIDYVDSLTKIYIAAWGEVRRYTRIELCINQTTVINETEVCMVFYNTSSTIFSLNATVVDSKINTIYYYDCLIEILDNELVMKLIEDSEVKEIKRMELPVIRVMLVKE